MFRAAMFLAAALASVTSYAARCSSSYCAPVNHYAQKVVREVVEVERNNITQNYFYSVGDAVRYPVVAPAAVVQAEYGQLERELQRVQDKMSDLKQYSTYQQPQLVCVPAVQAYCAPLQSQQYTQQYTQPSTPGYQHQQQQNRQNFSSRGAVVEAKCLKCHGNGGQIKGNLDLRGQLTCEQFKHAMARIMTDDNDLRMPKGQPPLTGEETASAIKELLAMTIQDRPAQLPVQQRPPQATQLPAPQQPPTPPQATQLPADQTQPTPPPTPTQLPAETPPAPVQQ